MKQIISMIAILVGVNAFGVESKVVARFGDNVLTGGGRQLYVYSTEKLTEVQYRFESTTDWSALSARATQEAYSAYGTDSYVQVKEGTNYVVRGILADGSRVTYSLKVDHSGEGRPRIQVELMQTETKEQVAEDKKKNAPVAQVAAVPGQEAAAGNAGGDPYGFIAILNQYRARHGLHAVTYDAGMSNLCHQNNQQASVVQTRRGLQIRNGHPVKIGNDNFAVGQHSAQGALNAWINSPGHEANLRAGGSRVGIAQDGDRWTMSIR